MIREKQSKMIEELPPPVFPIESSLIQIESKKSLSSTIPFNVIGHGFSGFVAVGKMENQKIAVKIFECDGKEDKEYLQIYHHGMRNLLQVNSKRLAKPLFDYYTEYKRTYESRTRVIYCQVMQYIKGITLLKYIQNNKHISFAKICWIALQIAQGLHDLHKNNLVHCDFRASNIMIEDETLNIYLCDFDFTLVENKQTHSLEISDKVYDGSSPPEHTMGIPHHFTAANDIYRFGTILYCLYIRDMGELNPSKLSSDKFSNLIKACTHINPSKRPSAAKIVKCLEKILKPELKKSVVSYVAETGISITDSFLPGLRFFSKQHQQALIPINQDHLKATCDKFLPQQ